MTQLPLLVYRGTGGIAVLVSRGLPTMNDSRAFRLVAATLIAWMSAVACAPATATATARWRRRAPTACRRAGPGSQPHNELKPFCPSLVDGQGGRVRSRGTGGAAEASFARDCPRDRATRPGRATRRPACPCQARQAKPSEPGLAVRGLAAGSVQADLDSAQDYADGTPLVVQVTPERLSATVLTGGTTLWLLHSGFWTYLLILGLPLWRHVDLLPIVDSASSEDEHPADAAAAEADEERAVAHVLQAQGPPRAGAGDATLMRIRPTVQMSLGLALLTSAVLLVVDLLFGVFTDPDVQLMRLRKALAESTATQVAVLLERGDHKTLGLTLARIREQDPNIRSLAVRRADRTLVAQSGNHRRTWGELEGDRSTLTQLLVPLGVGSERWGSFEVAYYPDERSALERAFGHPLGDRAAWHRAAGNARLLAVHPPRPGASGSQGGHSGARQAGLRRDDRRRGGAGQPRPGAARQPCLSRAAGRRVLGSGGQAAVGTALARGGSACRCRRAPVDARDAHAAAGHGLRDRGRAPPRDREEDWWSTVPRSAIRAGRCAAAWRPSTT